MRTDNVNIKTSVKRQKRTWTREQLLKELEKFTEKDKEYL